MNAVGQMGPVYLALLLVGIAGIFDHRTGRIPNLLTLGAALVGMTLAFVGGGIGGGIWAVAGGLGCALVPLVLFRVGAMGGGDVKLLFALGTLLGLETGLEAQSVSFVIGAVQGLALWSKRGHLKTGLLGTVALALPFVGKRLRGKPEIVLASKTTLKFGPAIALGSAVAVGLRFLA